MTTTPINDDIDRQLFRDIMFGLTVGSPAILALSVLIGTIAGIGLGNSLAMGIVPGFFGGMFFGGLVPMMRRLDRQERQECQERRDRASGIADIAARSQGEAAPRVSAA